MKKIRFGQPEEFLPSRYCKNFNYQEKEISYPIEKISV